MNQPQPILRILIAGCGFIGRRHARLLQEIGGVQLALCDPADSPREKLGHDLQIEESYASFDTAVTKKFNGVFICTPPSLHVEQAASALESGSDVFIEKPLCDQLDGIDALGELADAKQRLAMVGLCLRFHPGLRRVRELIAEGAIGRLLAVRAMVGFYLPSIRPGVDYRQVYIAQPGCGVILDYLHEIDFIQWIVSAPVRKVSAFAGKLSDLEMQSDDTAGILLRFENGVIGEIHLDAFQRARRRYSEFMGTEGTVILDFEDWNRCTLRILRASVGEWVSETLPMDRDQIYRSEDVEFLTCMRTRVKPSLDLRAGVASLRTALAAMASSTRDQVIDLRTESEFT